MKWYNISIVSIVFIYLTFEIIYYQYFVNLYKINTNNNTNKIRNDNYLLNITKDRTLISLSYILNQNSNLFKKWSNSNLDHELLFKILKPWIISNNSIPLSTQINNLNNNILNCSNIKYSNVLTGNIINNNNNNNNKRYIVDFVPFGFDFDKLIIRLHETYSFIDVFIIYESTRNQRGIKKELYLKETLFKQSRFKPYIDKIIYLSSNDYDLNKYIKKVNKSKNKLFTSINDKDLWALENSMRTEMVFKFNDISPYNITNKNSVLKSLLINNINNTWAIQNDADEIITGNTLYHIKNCEMKETIESIYMPCLSFKRNFHWLQVQNHVNCLKGKSINKDNKKLMNHLWKAGPYMWPLKDFLNKGSTLRGKYNDNWCKHHMGIGSSFHMSSVAEPVEFWLKKWSVVESSSSSLLDERLIKAGQTSSITPELIFFSTMYPWCRKKPGHPAVHISKLTFSSTILQIINETIPISVRENPFSFPFLAQPTQNIKENIDILMSTTIDKDWTKLCLLSNFSID